MSVAGSLREGWALARASALPEDGLRVVRLDGAPPAAWATVSARDRPGILVQASASQSLAATISTVNRASAVISGEIFPFEHGGKPARGLHLWCDLPELADVFIGFCEPFLERCRAGEPVDAAFSACMDEFRRLVASSDLAAVPTQVLGLLGELVVLSDLLQLTKDGVRYWAYPSLDRHDFRHGNVAMEVKTSLRSRQSRPVVTISAIDQLEAPGGGSLFLHRLLLERDPSGPIGIDATMDAIASKIPASEVAELWRRIEIDCDLGSVRAHRFSVQERQTYRVKDTFPRLTPSRLIARSLDPGIGRVSYELDLSTASAFTCAPAIAYASIIGNDPSL